MATFFLHIVGSRRGSCELCSTPLHPTFHHSSGQMMDDRPPSNTEQTEQEERVAEVDWDKADKHHILQDNQKGFTAGRTSKSDKKVNDCGEDGSGMMMTMAVTPRMLTISLDQCNH
jgi:hypothetical protein